MYIKNKLSLPQILVDFFLENLMKPNIAFGKGSRKKKLFIFSGSATKRAGGGFGVCH